MKGKFNMSTCHIPKPFNIYDTLDYCLFNNLGVCV